MLREFNLLVDVYRTLRVNHVPEYILSEEITGDTDINGCFDFVTGQDP